MCVLNLWGKIKRLRRKTAINEEEGGREEKEKAGSFPNPSPPELDPF